MARKLLPPTELLALIRERMRAHRDCVGCVPARLSPVKPVGDGVNWQVLEHPRCSAPCLALMLDACGALAEEYDVLCPRDESGALPTMAAAD